MAQIQTSTLVNFLQSHASGTRDLTDTQIRAIKILLDRTLPTLAATEITHVDENDKLSEGEIVAKLDALLAKNPELLDKIMARRASVAKVIEAQSNPDAEQNLGDGQQ